MMRVLAALWLAGLAACSNAAPTRPADVEPASTEPFSFVLTEAGTDAGLKFGRAEHLAEGLRWAEGPTWVDAEGGYLLFTDVPRATIWRYDARDGARVVIEPSHGPDAGNPMGRGGANGLHVIPGGQMLVPDHGTRTLYQRDLATGSMTTLASSFQKQPLNSPNDVVRHPSGTVYFTDPPYGLPDGDADERHAQDANGVYALSLDGTITRVTASLNRPNGIVLSPEGDWLYVSNSERNAPVILRILIRDDGTLDPRASGSGEVFRKWSPLEDGLNVLDGMAMAADGTLFATGLNGFVVLSRDGEVLASARLDRPCANIAFGGPQRSELYVTCRDSLYRVPVNRTGLR